MRVVDLTPYDVQVARRNENGSVEQFTTGYDVKASIAGILFLPELKVSGREAVLRDRLCEKIEAAENQIILEEADWKKIVEAVEQLPSVTRNDVKFIARVLDAPEYDPNKVS